VKLARKSGYYHQLEHLPHAISAVTATETTTKAIARSSIYPQRPIVRANHPQMADLRVAWFVQGREKSLQPQPGFR
jgi:hypothetical protein